MRNFNLLILAALALPLSMCAQKKKASEAKMTEPVTSQPKELILNQEYTSASGLKYKLIQKCT